MSKIKRPDLIIYNKKKNKKGKNNGNYKHGNFCKIHYCKCGNKISTITFIYGKGRCHSCAQKGNNNSNFKNGNTLQIICICGNKKDCRSRLCQKCYLKTLKGKTHPNWNDGISKLPYSFEFNNELKQSIRKRDNYICRLCKIKQKNLKGYHKHLTIHHIDYNKENCNTKNLITLCKRCNSKVNFNRDYWYSYFKYLLENN